MAISVRFFSRPTVCEIGDARDMGYDGSMQLQDTSEAEIQRGAHALDCMFGEGVATWTETRLGREHPMMVTFQRSQDF